MAIIVEHLQKNYGAFHLDCSMHIQDGTIVGIVGANGAGKSTLFKLLLGLVEKDAGMLQINGSEQLNVKQKQEIGVVLNDAGFNKQLKVKDLVPILQAMYPTFKKKWFLDKLNEYQIPLNKKLHQCSSGMQMKVKILSALSHDSKLLILDEPTSGLDVVARDEILTLLREYMEVESRIILISSHISSDLKDLCDKFYFINQGTVVLEEDSDVLLEEYGILKISKEVFQTIDQNYLLRIEECSNYYVCVTNQKQFYVENYPNIIVEDASIDTILMNLIKGEEL